MSDRYLPGSRPAEDNEVEAVPGFDPDNKQTEFTFEDGGIVKKIDRKGTGAARPGYGADVTVHYTGRLLDGTKFDSSVDRNEPFVFKLGQGQVISGWDKGVATMRKGEKATFTLKPDYAYGASGSPPNIPPNSTLVFEVELLSWSRKLKVTEDGGVMKEVFAEGKGHNKPNDGAKVVLKYVGSVKDGKVFDNKYATQAGNFTLVEDTNLAWGLEKAVLNMKPGEISLFTVQPEYGFGAAKSKQLGIDPNATLQFHVELLSFEKGRERWEMPLEEKLVYANARKLTGNTLYKQGEFRRAYEIYTTVVHLFKYEDPEWSTENQANVVALKLACYANLAACKLKERDLEKVISNCTEALNLDADNLKALVRRARCYAEQDKNDLAYADLKRARSVTDGKNQEVNRLYSAIRKRVQKVIQKEKQMFAGFFDKVKLTTDAEDQGLAERQEEAQRKKAAKAEKRRQARKNAKATKEQVEAMAKQDGDRQRAAEALAKHAEEDAVEGTVNQANLPSGPITMSATSLNHLSTRQMSLELSDDDLEELEFQTDTSKKEQQEFNDNKFWRSDSDYLNLSAEDLPDLE